MEISTSTVLLAFADCDFKAVRAANSETLGLADSKIGVVSEQVGDVVDLNGVLAESPYNDGPIEFIKSELDRGSVLSSTFGANSNFSHFYRPPEL